MLGFKYEAFTLFGWLSQNHSSTLYESRMQSEPRNARISVWALSISLAAPLEIDVSFSSSGYLDVSGHRVPSSHPIYSDVGDRSLFCRVSPFRYPRINRYLLLPVAFRSLSRLSSAPSAKASFLRPFLLYLLSAISCHRSLIDDLRTRSVLPLFSWTSAPPYRT